MVNGFLILSYKVKKKIRKNEWYTKNSEALNIAKNTYKSQIEAYNRYKKSDNTTLLELNIQKKEVVKLRNLYYVLIQKFKRELEVEEADYRNKCLEENNWNFDDAKKNYLKFQNNDKLIHNSLD